MESTSMRAAVAGACVAANRPRAAVMTPGSATQVQLHGIGSVHPPSSRCSAETLAQATSREFAGLGLRWARV